MHDSPLMKRYREITIYNERHLLFVYGGAVCRVNAWHFSDIAFQRVEMGHCSDPWIGLCHGMDPCP